MADTVWYSANVPADFPTRDSIALLCAEAGNSVCIRVAGKPRYWVKYAYHSPLRGEGRTQAHVAKLVNTNPASVVRVPEVYLGFSRRQCSYLVMDFVQGTTFAQRKSPKGRHSKDDIEAVAAAVRQLIEIKMPAGTAPGPIGGGFIGHNLFVEGMSSLEYPTVGHLEAQLNEVCFPLAFGALH
ncbi:hypothetical protein FA95DRAFT_1613902 [Auriscalpium vulgare]|uniref:Uncharacterized protein n=1 Tax=Auriscalpium vulgare TaxID=40419 RepID=A0ACB8R1U3_9AGAM|nr:hypothetical protein FA95DRAFT_1613902 [Auriscalpium vulgare]